MTHEQEIDAKCLPEIEAASPQVLLGGPIPIKSK
jgi:hypothetical protein